MPFTCRQADLGRRPPEFVSAQPRTEEAGILHRICWSVEGANLQSTVIFRGSLSQQVVLRLLRHLIAFVFRCGTTKYVENAAVVLDYGSSRGRVQQFIG